jgi:zinc D-Ala-D-Ala carboxypeptidase
MKSYFSDEELTCRCGCGLRVTPEAFQKANELRVAFGKPLYVNSSARCKAHNARIGGAPNSKHCDGVAFDFAVNNDQDRRNLVALMLQFGWGGIGVGKGFVHGDIRTGTRVLWGY